MLCVCLMLAGVITAATTGSGVRKHHQCVALYDMLLLLLLMMMMMTQCYVYV